jgi:molybdopterin biosynthesis enzyme MoaB
VLNAQRGASNVVLLTRLGGGAFGNDDRWIDAAMRRALEMMSGFALDVRLVSYGTPSKAILQMAEDFD